MPYLLPAGVLAIAMMASACSGSSEQTVEPASGQDSSIDQIERLLFGTEELSDTDIKQVLADSASREERVAVCMAQAGFEYFATANDVTSYQASDVDYLSREYAEEYGFGYTTNLEDPPWQSDSASTDPNHEYVSTLTSSEQEQYYLALYGDQSVWEGIDSEEERIALQAEQPELFEASGCFTEAESPENRATQAFYESHGEEIGELYEAAEAHSLVQAPLRLWQQCMAEHGHSFSTPDDFDTVMDPFMNKLYESATHPGDSLSEEEMSEMSEEELNKIWMQPSEYDADLLAEAMAYEIELAVTSWDCGLTDLYESYIEALDQLREQYIESNLVELQSLIADAAVKQ